MFLPWGNEIWQDSKCYVIMSLALSGVPRTFNPFYFSLTQLQGDFLTEQALWLLFRIKTCQTISSPALLMSLSCSCQFSKALLLGAQTSGVQLYFVSWFSLAAHFKDTAWAVSLLCFSMWLILPSSVLLINKWQHKTVTAHTAGARHWQNAPQLFLDIGEQILSIYLKIFPDHIQCSIKKESRSHSKRWVWSWLI